MKNRIKALFFLMLSMCIIQVKAGTIYLVPDDDEDAINQYLDEFHKTLKAKDLDGVMSYLDDDGLFCGTDQGEIWDKTDFYNYLKASGNPENSLPIEYTIDSRNIKVAKDGETAISVEHYIISSISKGIPFRFVTHLVKNQDQWKVDFFSWSFAPNNEDIGKLNTALE